MSGGSQETVTVAAGQVWRVRKTAEYWRVVKDRYDGHGTVRMVLLDPVRWTPRDVFDTVWYAELFDGAELIQEDRDAV